jgi:hypothetical protein
MNNDPALVLKNTQFWFSKESEPWDRLRFLKKYEAYGPIIERTEGTAAHNQFKVYDFEICGVKMTYRTASHAIGDGNWSISLVA